MERNLRKEIVGVVVSDKMNKTIVVAIKDKTKHPLYKKTINKTTSSITYSSIYKRRMRLRREFTIHRLLHNHACTPRITSKQPI